MTTFRQTTMMFAWVGLLAACGESLDAPRTPSTRAPACGEEPSAGDLRRAAARPRSTSGRVPTEGDH